MAPLILRELIDGHGPGRDILLEAGASVDARNARGETPLVVVSGRWDEGLAGIYRFLGNASGRVFDPEELRKARARMTSRLKEER